jgi:hypothetical protein
MRTSFTQDAPRAEQIYPQEWTAFFKDNCHALFQTALLLSADPDEAEAIIVAALDSIDVANPPSEPDVAALHIELVRKSMERARPIRFNKVAQAQSMLHSALRPVLEIERSPRICFVLRMLLGHATSSCARWMNIEEQAARTLLRIAVLQLQNAISGEHGVSRKESTEKSGHCSID